jgi:type I site-specific restriction endonuclease
VAEQTIKYITKIEESLPQISATPAFSYETTGVETYFRDLRDPESRSRRVFSFHQPKTLNDWLIEEDTLRNRLKRMPPLIKKGLRDCQTEAIENLEKSFADSKPKALIQMASGGGKTFTAVSFIYRLIKFAKAKRVLFLVDRSNLGRQTKNEFQQYVTPDDGRKFTELYNIQHLTSNTLDPVSRVCITTIQRLYSMLKGEPEFDPDLEEQSVFEMFPYGETPKEVVFNPQIPIETLDFIVTDECHRSIYPLWRQVLEYFDAFIIGLTATPSKQTLGFFDQNLVMEYSHERAVADGVNVGYDVYRIQTEITKKGSKVEAGFFIDKRDKLTRKTRWEQLDNDLDYAPAQLDRNKATEELVKQACIPFDSATFRNTLITIKQKNEQIIDTVSKDSVILAGFDERAKEKARTIVDTFRRFIEENKDELTAIQLIYKKPYGQRHLTYEEIRQLAESIEKPPYNLTPELVWQAYEQLEKSKVKGAGPQKLLTNIISLIRFTIGETEILEPFSDTVEQRFTQWLTQQQGLGKKFTAEQMQWLKLIKDHIATSLSIGTDDFEYAPFYEKGGAVKVYQLFGQQLNGILNELNERLAA